MSDVPPAPVAPGADGRTPGSTGPVLTVEPVGVGRQLPLPWRRRLVVVSMLAALAGPAMTSAAPALPDTLGAPTFTLGILLVTLSAAVILVTLTLASPGSTPAAVTGAVLGVTTAAVSFWACTRPIWMNAMAHDRLVQLVLGGLQLVVPAFALLVALRCLAALTHDPR